eukprot:4884696-Amphidinium_carterae.1
MREITGLERQEDNEREDAGGSGGTEDRETTVEYNEEREIDNEYMTGSEFKESNEIDEIKETMEYNEYGQTIRFCNHCAMRQTSSRYT